MSREEIMGTCITWGHACTESQTNRQKGQTDRQTDRLTDRQTDLD